MKRYDRDYFERWYRGCRRVGSPGDLVRTVSFAVAAAERLLGRRLRSVLDVGCGEGRWQPVLQRIRPGSRYAGVDSSPYAVERFGRRRNIRLGTFGSLTEAGVAGHYDLVVCADVLHYVPTPELGRGLAELRQLVGGMAYLELYTSDDAIVGDRAGFMQRPPTVYRRALRRAGLVACGLHCYVPLGRAFELAEMERPAR